ncbi:uncharacterized protein LOC129777384 [Toxorhynchites rutilus septentrionalis]|uniref:uncharacterized protein LOC129777384 n=1 Tax=Toxorhynchites rutilus septentrionalis TaxID=329112 RepID=UPI00247AA212|nr:uncharacterized protein LOC129777384 [Toxorhynchites rutilus septentrionalis]
MSFKFLLLLVATAGAESVNDSQNESTSQNIREQIQQQIEDLQQRYIIDTSDQRKVEPVGYEFAYSVSDPTTGDFKSQEESSRNGKVRGQFSWVDANGIRQIVNYRADDRNGFNSEHRREPAITSRLTPVLHLVPAPITPLYTIDTVIAPVYTSAARVENLSNRNHDNRNEPKTRIDDRNSSENRDDREKSDKSDEGDKNTDTDTSSAPNGGNSREDTDNRGTRDGPQPNNEVRRGRDSLPQSEVRFQDPVVSYQYKS